jgi:serine/threonine-protein kinase
LVGQQIGSFQVLSLLGAGGMGEVYLAEDRRLERTVALKILSAELASDPGRMRRFIREAKAASSLKHPNVATIHEIGESKGVHFIAMEYVEGHTLASKISGRPLEIAAIVEIALQVADALDEAHLKHITHRDIKPANVMLTPRGQVKVLDFGLAKITPPEGGIASSDLTTAMSTESDVVMGTLPYMSPEKVLGKQVDHRTDIFSLGAVLYEMATGRLPFPGISASETTDRILHGQPEAIARFNYEVPTELERIVRKCLEKDRERRYQSARELLIDLRNLSQDIGAGKHKVEEVVPAGRNRRPMVVAALVAVILALGGAGMYLFNRLGTAIDAPLPSVAVLPFTNVGGDSNADYLSDGITESLINSLSRLTKLRVIARTTVFRYKKREIDPQAVGRDLGVRAIVTGRVDQQGGTLSIQADLIDVANGSQLWGEKYRHQLSDIFVMQEEIAKQISEKLRFRLTGEEEERLAKHYTENVEAYQLYLKGRYQWNKRTQDGLNKAIEYFEKAIEKDPSYALSHAGIADAYLMLGFYKAIPFREGVLRAKRLVSKALQIDEKLAEAHNSLAYIRLYYDWDLVGAEREFKRAIELNPNYATAHQWHGTVYEVKGLFEEALDERKQALVLDPLSLAVNAYVGRAFYFARQYDQAIEQLLRTLELDPTFAQAHSFLGQAYLQKKMYREAIAEFKKASMTDKDNTAYLSLLGHAYALFGARREALTILDTLKVQNKQRDGIPYCLSLIYAGLGKRELALEWLQEACEERDPSMIHLKGEPPVRQPSLGTEIRKPPKVRWLGTLSCRVR